MEFPRDDHTNSQYESSGRTAVGGAICPVAAGDRSWGTIAAFGPIAQFRHLHRRLLPSACGRQTLYSTEGPWRAEDGTRIPSRGSATAGLASVIRYLLAANGTAYFAPPDADLPNLGQPNFTWVTVRHRPDYELIDFVAQAPAGLILHRPGRIDPVWLVEQAILSYPEARVVIATSNIQTARYWAQQLRRQFRDVQLRVDTWEPCHSAGIVVGLFNQLGGGSVALEQRDLFFANRADEVISDIGNLIYPHIQRARIFGLLPWDAQLRGCKSTPSCQAPTTCTDRPCAISIARSCC